MARRGAALVDIKTNEELDGLLENQCVHVLNVYDGFFGPCNAIATNLRDFKLLQGGDDLQVTTVNVDNIDAFRRFRNKSEPTYLFVVDSHIINSYYGTNVYELIEIIKDEIAIFKSDDKPSRQQFELRDMSTLEAQRFRTKRDEMIFKRMQEQLKKQQLVHDYRIKVTDDIMDNCPDIGITVFMPHTLHDKLAAELIDPGQQSNMTLKTSIVTQITKEDLEMINFDQENMSPVLYNHIRDKDVLIVAWKMAPGELKPIDEIFSEFTKTLRDQIEFEKNKGSKKKKKGKGKQKKKAVVEEKPKGAEQNDENEEEKEKEIPPFKLPPIPVSLKELMKQKADPIQIEPIDLQFIESDKDIIKLVSESIMAYTEQCITKMHNQCIKEALAELIDSTEVEKDEEEEGEDKEKSKKKKKKKSKPKSTARGEVIFDPNDKEIGYVCPVWSAPSPRSHASILYLYFRRLLSFFLPMDPPGASKYLLVAFDAKRHEEILEFMIDNPGRDILAHGIFRGFVNGENFENTVLITKTGIEYRMGIQQPDDKIMLKVVSSSETLLMLADMDPNYVSQNEIDAQKECDIIFPLGFTSMSEEEAEAEMKLEGNLEEDDEELDLQSEATEATEASEVTRSQAENDTINSESDPKAEEQTVEEEKVDEDKVEEEKVKKPEIDQTHENITEEANIEGVNVIQANNANNESVEENGTEIK